MTRRLNTIAPIAAAALAFAWPWDVYLYIPRLGRSLDECLALLLIAVAAYELRPGRGRARALRIPFEFLWPALLVAALGTMLWLRAPAKGGPAVMGALLFLATAQLTDARLCGNCLRLTALSGAGVALQSLLRPVTAVPPTAYHLDTGPVFAFAADVPGGFLTLLLCAIAALALPGPPLDNGRRHILRVAAVLPIALLLDGLRRVAPAIARGDIDLTPARVTGSFVETAALLLLVWLAARIAAKHVLRARGLPTPATRPAVTTAILVMVGAGACYALPVPVTPRLHYAFLLGLAAGAALRDRPDDPAGIPSPTPTPLWALIPMLVAPLNLWTVHPENTRDPRNYDVAARADLDAGRLHELERRMAYFESFSPLERRTHLWRARAALVRGQWGRASEEFMWAMDTMSPQGLLLQGLTTADRDDFLIRLRDACSEASDPARGFFYERALVATGEDLRALAALRQRIEALPVSDDALYAAASPAPVRNAVGSLLCARQIIGWPLEWTTDMLAQTLRLWGATLESAPAGAPAAVFPLAVTAVVTVDGIELAAYSGEGGRPAPTATAPPPQELAATASSVEMAWGPLEPDGRGAWVSTLRSEGTGIARMVVAEGAVTFETEERAAPKCPDRPALRVWFP